MKPEIPLKGGDEQDGLTGWRHVLHWRHGKLRWIKTKYNRRVRKFWRRKIHGGSDE